MLHKSPPSCGIAYVKQAEKTHAYPQRAGEGGGGLERGRVEVGDFVRYETHINLSARVISDKVPCFEARVWARICSSQWKVRLVWAVMLSRYGPVIVSDRSNVFMNSSGTALLNGALIGAPTVVRASRYSMAAVLAGVKTSALHLRQSQSWRLLQRFSLND